MTLLTPLGLLGLIGIIVFFIIYFLKPNYQNKMVSSTYLWKLSLKYKRKRIPLSKLRNILLIICQVLILALCAFLLTQPVIPAGVTVKATEKIFVIDASADMYTQEDGVTRFDRAIDLVEQEVQATLQEGGIVTVIVADEDPDYLVDQRLSDGDLLYTALNDLAKAGACYTSADMDGAMALVEDTLEYNPDASVYLYTATTYYDPGVVTVVDVSVGSEWNLALSNPKAEYADGYYSFSVDVTAYNKDLDVTVHCDVSSVNGGKQNSYFTMDVRCEGDETQTITFDNSKYAGVYSYDYVHIYVEVSDSYDYDNSFWLFGGTKQEVKVQYCSSKANKFFSAALNGLRTSLASTWDISIDETTSTDVTEGYDVYIFEQTMPSVVPTDGIVLFINPDELPTSVGVKLGSTSTQKLEFSNGESHPITENLDFTGLILSEYTRITNPGEFTPLLYCGGDPILLVKNTDTSKIVIMPFSLNMSDLAVNIQFPILMYNIFNYFLPATVTGTNFEIGDTVELNARGSSLTVSYDGNSEQYTTFPAELTFATWGTYTLKQTLMSGNVVVENIYVAIPAAESNIFKVVDSLNAPVVEAEEEKEDYKLAMYFAAVLVGLMFIEWLLQAKNQM